MVVAMVLESVKDDMSDPYFLNFLLELLVCFIYDSEVTELNFVVYYLTERPSLNLKASCQKYICTKVPESRSPTIGSLSHGLSSSRVARSTTVRYGIK